MKSSVSSSPSVNGQGSGRGQWPLRMWRSVPQTPQAAMRMSAALGGTSGLGTSRITGGSPGPSKVATWTFGMDPPNCTRKAASTALPRAATYIRGKIHNGYNPVNPLRRASGRGADHTCLWVRSEIYCCQGSGYKHKRYTILCILRTEDITGRRRAGEREGCGVGGVGEVAVKEFEVPEPEPGAVLAKV